MSIYCWTLGEIALARICEKVYAKVQITKNEKGLFYKEMVLGLSINEDETLNYDQELCYYVELLQNKKKMWLPYTCLRLAERSRPFYGLEKTPAAPKAINVPSKKRKPKEDYTLPMSAAKQAKVTTEDLNVTFDLRQLPMRLSKYENAYKDFIRRGKDMIFDEFLCLLQNDTSRCEDLEYIFNIDASTEDKFETVIKNIMTEKEVKNYLQLSWRYNHVNRQVDVPKDNLDMSNPQSPEKSPVTIHANWCLVCGKREKLLQCLQCPASFHAGCKNLWVATILHRKNPPKQGQEQVTRVEKILSSTRTICTVEKYNVPVHCPSCVWGPAVGYGDVVWHKLGSCPWWPAKVLSPGTLPSCLISRRHNVNEWPVQYYGANNYSWCDPARMCLFLPSHTAVLDENKAEDLQEAVLDACDDYIVVYLT